MVARKTLSCFFLVVVGIVIVAQASAYEDEWNTEVFEEESVTDDSLGRRCPKKEHYDKCKASCDKTCFDYNENPGVCPQDCKPGCICNRGYVRGPDGSCIKPKKCPSTKCPSGEHHDKCLLNCQKDCSNWNSTHIPCTDDCKPGCVCDEGTVRSSLPDGKCIKPEECKVPEEKEEGLTFFCKKNETYSVCPSLCPDNCTNHHDTRRACKIVCLPLPGCVCKSGYVKGPDGKCIKPDECQRDKKPEDCTEYEQYTTCGTSCEDNCDNYRERDRDCGKRCNVGCFCLPGYVRGPKGDCIFPFDCPAKSSQRNETVEEKTNNSEHEIPKEDDSTRDPKYDKIPEDTDNSEIEFQEEEKDEPRMFPQSLFCKGQKNKIYSLCPSVCPDNCTNYQDKNRACKLICLPLPACVCKSGYVHGPDGTCIKPEMCNKNQKPDDCLDNEYYDTCGSSCAPDCKNYNSDDNTCDKKCNIGCFCRPGMVKGPNGKCIWPFECEVKSSNSEDLENIPSTSGSNFCPPHEDFDPCHVYSEHDCSNRNNTTFQEHEAWCMAGCRCRPGNVRGPNGDCIEPKECPDDDNTKYPVRRICPKNEAWSYAAMCQRNCSDTRIKLCSRIPSPGCVCKQGFLRNLEGKCVPESGCPGNQQGVGIIDNSPSSNDPCPDLFGCRRYCETTPRKNGYCAGLFCICF